MSLKRFAFGSSDYLFLQIKDFLRQSSLVQNKPNYEAVYDNSLRSSLAEFQKNKRLQITDGSLNPETFQAFGEEMNNSQLSSILFHNRKLKSLFVNGKSSRKFALEPDVVMVPLNIVYDPKLLPSDSKGKDPLQFVKDSFKPKLDYWEETFRKLYLGYTVDFTIGTASQYRDRITSGAKDGYANIFFLDDGHRKLGAYAVFFPESRHIFISEQYNDKMYRRSLCHELFHLFGITSTTELWWIDNYLGVFENLISDARINWALRQLKYNSVRYGIDWVEDYRNAHDNVIVPGGGTYNRKRSPSIYDIIRVGAMILREQKK